MDHDDARSATGAEGAAAMAPVAVRPLDGAAEPVLGDGSTETGGRPVPSSGFQRALWRRLERIPVPPPLSPRTWRSPLRGPWLTSVFGAVLLVGLPVVIVTGLLS